MQSGNAAFVTPAVVACGSFVAGAATCSISAPPATVAPAVTMRCRRDLKKEKSLRNLEYARQHRKKAPSRYNRRSAQQEQNNGDNEYLSDVRFASVSFLLQPLPF